jgi:hypothetical protein
MKNKKNLCRIIYLLALLALSSYTAYSQSAYTQTVRGIIVDADTKSPLPGATIIVDDLQPSKGTTADINGIFHFAGIPVGRHNFRVTFIGYEPYILSEILIGSGKEVVLNIELKESSQALSDIVVRANTNKDKPVNTMATLSARTFSVEETSRYAGGLDDPARLASAFAGVTTTQTQTMPSSSVETRQEGFYGGSRG